MPVTLEHAIRYHRELRGGDEVDVSCAFTWGGARCTASGSASSASMPAAEIDTVGGMITMTHRRLVADPAEQWRALAGAPEFIGL